MLLLSSPSLHGLRGTLRAVVQGRSLLLKKLERSTDWYLCRHLAKPMQQSASILRMRLYALATLSEVAQVDADGILRNIMKARSNQSRAHARKNLLPQGVMTACGS